ncbi:MAG: hypothetical protein V4693_02210 [Pseudomonadota bacterium]
MSGGHDGASKLKLSDPRGSNTGGNVAFGMQSIEDQIAESLQRAEYEKRIQQLERNIAKLKKSLEQNGKPKPQAKSGGQGKARHIAHAEGWQAVCTAPDFCRVGKDVVAFNSFATLDQQLTASQNVKARGTPIYRKGDVLQSVQADAGKHVVSGTSLGSGHVKILDGHANVKVNGAPVARHDSRCLINCDASGAGGAQGKLVTEQKTAGTVAPPEEPVNPPGQRTSAKLEALKKARDAVVAGMTDLDALDEYVNFERSHEELDGLINKISGTPGSARDYAAQVARGLLGFGKDAALGLGELAYETIKGVPKLVRLTQTQSGRMQAQLDAQILVEDMRLGNVTPGGVGRTALDLGKAVIAPVTDPWAKGHYVEAVTRATTEAGSLLLGWLKASRAARAAKAQEVARAGVRPAAVEIPAVDAVVAKADDGVHIGRPEKPAFSGDWKNYKTNGIEADPILSAEGRRMIAEFEKKGLKPARAIEETELLMKTGASLPVAKSIEVGDKFYKLVTEGASIGENSAFWATKDEILALEGKSYDKIANQLGMPLISQQGTRFQVSEITALRSGTSFSSIIAPTTEIGAKGIPWLQEGGRVQTLLIDRSAFSPPVVTKIKFP